MTLVLLAGPAFSAEVPGQEPVLSEPEKVARAYMTAFFHGDLERAASLTHPDTLNSLRRSMLQELNQRDSQTQEKITPADLGLTLSVSELEKLSPEAFYVTIVEADHRRNPVAFEAMKQARVDVLSSKITAGDTAIVTLRIGTPSGASPATQETRLALRKSGSRWMVVGNAP